MDKPVVPVARLALSDKKSTDIVDKVPTALGFAAIISMGRTRYGSISTTLLEDYL